jgi:hypothetical protein
MCVKLSSWPAPQNPDYMQDTSGRRRALQRGV